MIYHAKSVVRGVKRAMVVVDMPFGSYQGTRGVPFLARVPVIKWFFGKEKRNKVERTLNIFIKPTVVE